MNLMHFTQFYILNLHLNINFGWIIRFMHANSASMFLYLIFMHICRSLFYNSFNKSHLWSSSITILLLVMSSAFLSYVLPWGQMSFWGATVITNLISAIPFYSVEITNWIWSSFSVIGATLTRFYTFHFLFPFVVLSLMILHLFLLHMVSSSNPISLWSFSKINFYPFYFIKDFITFNFMLLILIMFSFNFPLEFMDADNWMLCNPMVTPNHIKPEWYFLFAYAILRCIPSKSISVLGLLFSLLILYLLSLNPILKFSNNFNTFNFKLSFYLWCFNFMLLTYLGGMHVLPYYVMYAQFFSLFYFIYILILLY